MADRHGNHKTLKERYNALTYRLPWTAINQPNSLLKGLANASPVQGGIEMAETHEGGCLCGSVRYRVTGQPNLAAVCHCTRCKRMTGSAFSIPAYFDDSVVQITRGVLKTYECRSDETNRWLKIEFCPSCGTTVTWTAEWAPRGRGIAVGTLDDPNWIKPARHIWTRSALHWMAFPAAAERIETQPEIDVGSFLSDNFPPHVHAANCPECAVLVDLSLVEACCEEPDLHVLAAAGDQEVFVQCLNPKCNKQAYLSKRS